MSAGAPKQPVCVILSSFGCDNISHSHCGTGDVREPGSSSPDPQHWAPRGSSSHKHLSKSRLESVFKSSSIQSQFKMSTLGFEFCFEVGDQPADSCASQDKTSPKVRGWLQHLSLFRAI